MTEQDLENVVRRIIDGMGGKDAKPVPTVGELWTLYAASQGRTLKVLHEVESMMRRVVLPLWGATPATQVDGAAWARLVADVLEDGTASAATINKWQRQLGAVFTWAVHAGLLAVSPLKSVPYLQGEPVHDVGLTRQEFDALMVYADEITRAMALLAFDCFMRRGEILALRWDCLDPKRRVAKLTAGTTKTGAGRTVPITDRAWMALQALPSSSGWVFPSPEAPDSHVGPTALRWRWETLLERADMVTVRGQKLRFHDLRHAAASNAIRDGVSEAHVRLAGGWKSPTAMARYVHYREDDYDRVRYQLNKAAMKGSKK